MKPQNGHQACIFQLHEMEYRCALSFRLFGLCCLLVIAVTLAAHFSQAIAGELRLGLILQEGILASTKNLSDGDV
jgi:hypothetical protein